MLCNNSLRSVSNMAVTAGWERSFDLGQFERFRRILHTSHYATLLGHEEAVPLSSLQLAT
ncbi:uncharacterized protein LOC107839057 [Haematococcus lacustris]|uniref:Uncharacterized protein LOC107839057 n=1 Tax=Haematococcus lacustris TaxID=44745 RepID=A0A699ZVE0_HAELA|nr:uncharacterized protein LOC107839057 [Haematococcus lacustris]